MEKILMRNTKFSYFYRDASNYKTNTVDIVAAGELTPPQIRHIQWMCLDGRNFIASQVGLPDPQTYWAERGYVFPTDDDHVYAEFCTEGDWNVGVKITDDPPTPGYEADGAALKIMEAFDAVRGHWDETAAMERLGIN
jgi:hypothetical protein